jgi:hypothetical protein
MPASQDYFGSISDTRDRRRHSRQVTALNYIRLGESNGGILLNVSEDGLAFTAAEPLASEFIPRLRFQLAEKAEWIEASGRIVWLNDSKKGAGIEFIDISNAGREQIRQWIESKKPRAEIQEPVNAARKTRKESEVTPFPAPKNDTHKIETQYEILEPHLRKMFPSESVLEVETARPAPPPQVTAYNETQAASRAQYFPSESDEDRESAVTSAPPIERQPVSHETRYAESVSENVRAAEPRFRQAVQIETLPETNQIHQQEKESAPPESARLMEQSDEAPETTPDSVARTNQFQPGDSAARAVRVPNFGYQISPSELSGRAGRVPSFGYQTAASSYQQPEDWTNWVDPAANPHRGKLGFVVVGVLLVVAAFAIGMAFGHGSFDGLLESIRERVPDKYQLAPSASGPSAGSASTSTSETGKTKPETPAQAQSDTSSAQTSETPSAPSPATPPSEPASSRTSDTETHPEAASSVAEVAGPSGRGKAAATESDSTILVSAAGSGNGPFRLTTPETAVSASSSVAISSQATVLVPRAAGADPAQEAKRLQLGILVFHVEPQYPKKVGRSEVEIVKVLATVGENGQVTNVQRISGPPLFASAAISAIREWKYSPTLFDGRPVKTEEKITVAFRSR